MKTAAHPLGHDEHGLLLGQLALVLAPQARTLPLAVSLLLMLLMLWRWLLWQQRAPLPSRLALGTVAGLVVLTGAALAWQDGGSVGRELAVALLGAFVVLKLLECRALADATFVTQLCFYLLLSLYLFEQPFWLAMYGAGVAAWMLRNWLWLQHPEARARLAPWPMLARMALLGLPWALLLFLLFPRLEQPLWRLPQAARTATTGLSDTMRPGSVGELIRSAEPAFHATLRGAPLPNAALYWRAMVLWHYDGTAWLPDAARRRTLQPPPPLSAAAAGDAVDYDIALEPSGQRWLLLLDRGRSLEQAGSAAVTVDGEFLAGAPADHRLQYRARSAPPPAAEILDERTARLALELPPGNARSRALARQWQTDLAAPWQRVQAALQLFAGAPFRYTLSPPPLGQQQVDSFLFGTRSGFCEHYAGSFVFLMRAAGVPARVVTGYQGGEYNPIGGHYLVRQSDAHAWAEVWLAGRGWVRVDPTAAVAPDRIDLGAADVLGDGAAGLGGWQRGPAWLRRLHWGLDGMVYAWQRWVLQYDRRQQARLLGHLERLGIGASLMQLLLAGMAVLALLLPLPWWLRRRGTDPVTALYARFCARLGRLGCVRRIGEGPRDFATRAAAQLPAVAPHAQAFIDAYIALRYGTATAQQRAAALAIMRRTLGKLARLRRR